MKKILLTCFVMIVVTLTCFAEDDYKHNRYMDRAVCYVRCNTFRDRECEKDLVYGYVYFFERIIHWYGDDRRVTINGTRYGITKYDFDKAMDHSHEVD